MYVWSGDILMALIQRVGMAVSVCHVYRKSSRGVADIVSVTMPLLSIKDLAVAISTRAEPAEDDPPLYNLPLPSHRHPTSIKHTHTWRLRNI